MKEQGKCQKGVGKEVDNAALEKTIKRIERINRFLTVAVVVEALVLVLFL
jgi:hypothetical protein